MTDNQEPSGYPLARQGRVLLGLWSLLLVCVFCIAGWLEPDPRGFGTHQRLGLPACTFRTMFGVPCPSCGMTTSFSNFVRGRFIAAAEANVAGLLLAVLCAVQIPWSWVSIYSGRLWWVERPDFGLMWMLGLICAVSALEWVLRLLL